MFISLVRLQPKKSAQGIIVIFDWERNVAVAIGSCTEIPAYLMGIVQCVIPDAEIERELPGMRLIARCQHAVRRLYHCAFFFDNGITEKIRRHLLSLELSERTIQFFLHRVEHC